MWVSYVYRGLCLLESGGFELSETSSDHLKKQWVWKNAFVNLEESNQSTSAFILSVSTRRLLKGCALRVVYTEFLLNLLRRHL